MLTISSVQRKSAVSVIALLMAILCFSSLLSSLIEKTPLAYMDQRATTYVETTMARAAYTFAIVRGLNGMISVIQGTEIAVSPAGIGLNLSVGEVLDPINDLAERFSWIMLASTASLGVQRILMEMGDWLGLRVLLTMAMAKNRCLIRGSGRIGAAHLFSLRRKSSQPRTMRPAPVQKAAEAAIPRPQQ